MLIRFGYESISYDKKTKKIVGSTPGCGCCGGDDDMSPQDLLEIIEEIEENLFFLKEIYKEVKNG